MCLSESGHGDEMGVKKGRNLEGLEGTEMKEALGNTLA
jgi:hypothetical protein